MGSVPVYSSTDSIKCSHGITINIRKHVQEEGYWIDYCSAFRSIQAPIRKLLKDGNSHHRGVHVERFSSIQEVVGFDLDEYFTKITSHQLRRFQSLKICKSYRCCKSKKSTS